MRQGGGDGWKEGGGRRGGKKGRRAEHNKTANDRHMDRAIGTMCIFCLIHKLMH